MVACCLRRTPGTVRRNADDAMQVLWRRVGSRGSLPSLHMHVSNQFRPTLLLMPMLLLFLLLVLLLVGDHVRTGSESLRWARHVPGRWRNGGRRGVEGVAGVVRGMQAEEWDGMDRVDGMGWVGRGPEPTSLQVR